MDQPVDSPRGLSGEWFAQVAVPAIFAPFASDLLRSAALQPGERVLDVACGTGIVSEEAARIVGTDAIVAALDLDRARIAVGQRRMRRSGMPVGFLRGAAERLPFAGACFDVVLCQFGLMLFSDPAEALREIKRVLAPGGRLLLSVWDDIDLHPLDREIHELSLRRLGASGVSDVYALGDERALEQLMRRAGFEHVEIEHVTLRTTFPDPGSYLDWQMQVDPAQAPVLRDLDGAARQAVLASLRAELEPVMQKYLQDGVLPLELHALKAACRLSAA